MIIVLEGVDGTGKTTVSERLATTTGSNYRHYPVDYHYWYNITRDKQMAMAVDLVVNSVDANKDWVLDRYLPSSRVYGMDNILYNTIENLVPPADYNILLCCNPYVAYNRMLGRGLDELDPGEAELEAYQQRYLDLGIWDFIVDTTHKTTLEVYNDVKLFTEACYNGVL